MSYLFPSLAAFGIAAVLTVAVRAVAIRLRILDIPNAPRKIHTAPMPLLGGIAIFVSFFLVLAWQWLYGVSISWHISPNAIFALFIGSAALMIGGALDDKYRLKPTVQIIFPLVAALAAVAGGIGVSKITNPFGGTIPLDLFVWLPSVFTFVWLMGMMFTTKFLDGLDGLTSGVGAIASIMIFALANTDKFFQPDVAMSAAIFTGALIGFLVWNFHPAKIFLGEGGSLFIGYLLGSLAIISGGKIATALLVMGVPVMDALFVIIRRAFIERHSPARADRGHFHFQLLAVGLTQRQTVAIYYVVAAGFGATTLFLQSRQKLFALMILVGVMTAVWTISLQRTRK